MKKTIIIIIISVVIIVIIIIIIIITISLIQLFALTDFISVLINKENHNTWPKVYGFIFHFLCFQKPVLLCLFDYILCSFYCVNHGWCHRCHHHCHQILTIHIFQKKCNYFYVLNLILFKSFLRFDEWFVLGISFFTWMIKITKTPL